MRTPLPVYLGVSLAALCSIEARSSEAGPPWTLPVVKGQRAPTTVTAVNRCRRSHTFQAQKNPDMTWFHFLEQTKIKVSPKKPKVLQVEIDTVGMEVGSYDGTLTVNCIDCRKEPMCTQDREVLPVTLKVLWPDHELERLDRRVFLPDRVLAVLAGGTDGAHSAADDLASQYGLTPLRTFHLTSVGWTVAVLGLPDPGTGVAPIVAGLQRDDRIRLAQPTFRYETAAGGTADPYSSLQYGPRTVRVPEVHQHATGTGVTVAIIDTGLDYRHQDLQDKVTATINVVEGDTGFAGDLHGTLVAGVIAAEKDNGIGIFGVAPDARVIAIKACKPRGTESAEADATSESLARGLDLALAKGAQVINLSLGGPKDPLIARLVEEASRREVILVAAAGNGGAGARPAYPAAFDQVIAVSATDTENTAYELANRGDYIDLAAPGVEILSTVPGDGFNPSTGTSLAAAHVTGVVALILERRPGLSPDDIAHYLKASARDLGQPGHDLQYGAGLIDACQALSLALGETICQ